jgi:hypothetical protein
MTAVPQAGNAEAGGALAAGPDPRASRTHEERAGLGGHNRAAGSVDCYVEVPSVSPRARCAGTCPVRSRVATPSRRRPTKQRAAVPELVGPRAARRARCGKVWGGSRSCERPGRERPLGWSARCRARRSKGAGNGHGHRHGHGSASVKVSATESDTVPASPTAARPIGEHLIAASQQAAGLRGEPPFRTGGHRAERPPRGVTGRAGRRLPLQPRRTPRSCRTGRCRRR